MDLQDGKRMFGDIKSKLGFGSKNPDRGYDDAYGDGYDDYDEYEEYGEDYDDYGDGAPSSSYDRYAPVTTRSARGRTADSTMPRLVSIEDVRANTQSSSGASRDASPRHASAEATSRSFGRTMVDSSRPPQMTPEGTAAVSAAASRRRSEGLDSLFTPTTDGAETREETPRSEIARSSAQAAYAATVQAANASAAQAASQASAQASKPVAPAYTGRRTLRVLKPGAYAEAENVAKALKGGDVVILVLSETPADLVKRILDFSFGAAAVLDASVECVADHIFAIATGSGLSEVERMTLRNQGVLS